MKTQLNETLDGKTLEIITGLTDRRHRQLADQGYFPPPAKGMYQTLPTLQGILRHYQECADRKVGDKLEAERTRLTTAQADIAEIERAKLQSEVLPVEVMMEQWENMAHCIRRIILTSKLPPEDQDAILLELKRDLALGGDPPEKRNKQDAEGEAS